MIRYCCALPFNLNSNVIMQISYRITKYCVYKMRRFNHSLHFIETKAVLEKRGFKPNFLVRCARLAIGLGRGTLPLQLTATTQVLPVMRAHFTPIDGRSKDLLPKFYFQYQLYRLLSLTVAEFISDTLPGRRLLLPKALQFLLQVLSPFSR